MNINDIEKLNENTSKELSKLIRKFVSSYTHKDDSIDDVAWLKDELKSELKDLSDEEAQKLSEECFNEIKTYDNNLSSLVYTIKNGGTKESWLSQKSKEAYIGMSINEYGDYLKSIDDVISLSNAQMQDVVINTRGNQQISQNMNLDGFIAEQYHVSSFNMNAGLNKSGYKAKVLDPKPGETYKKNSFDVVIVDSNEKIVHQYQFKYGKTAKHTIAMIKKGNYNNQRIVVPADQVDDIRKAFPNKTIEDHIGGTDKVTISSSSLTKYEAKEIQNKTQENSQIHKEDWNYFNTKELTINIAKNASLAGIQSAVISSGFDIAKSIMDGEKIEADEIVYNALVTGVDSGIKAATVGALHVGVQRGVISVIPKGTPIAVLTNVTCVSIENIKIMGQVINGDITSTEAIDKMGLTSMSMIYGLSLAAKGAASLYLIPVVGPILGGFIGGTVGYMAGSKFGERIYKAGKKIASKARDVCRSIVLGIGNAVSTVTYDVKNFVSGLFR